MCEAVSGLPLTLHGEAAIVDTGRVVLEHDALDVLQGLGLERSVEAVNLRVGEREGNNRIEA